MPAAVKDEKAVLLQSTNIYFLFGGLAGKRWSVWEDNQLLENVQVVVEVPCGVISGAVCKQKDWLLIPAITNYEVLVRTSIFLHLGSGICLPSLSISMTACQWVYREGWITLTENWTPIFMGSCLHRSWSWLVCAHPATVHSGGPPQPISFLFVSQTHLSPNCTETALE